MNDPVAMCEWGKRQFQKGEYRIACDYWAKAAELGDADAHYGLGTMYRWGQGIEKDEGKEIYHFEKAAVAGHPEARYQLGNWEWSNSHNPERAVRHWIISATHGHDGSMKSLMSKFREGFVEKDVLTTTLRVHKAAVDATKSPQREEAEVMNRLIKEKKRNEAS